MGLPPFALDLYGRTISGKGRYPSIGIGNMTRKILAFLLIATALSACGVRGDPEPPPNFNQAQ